MQYNELLHHSSGLYKYNMAKYFHKFFTLQCPKCYIGCGMFGSYTGEGSDMDGKCDTQVSQKDSGYLPLCAAFW